MGKILILEKRTIEKVDEHNFAFIDAQNLYKSLIKSGWKLDYFKFRKYLQKKFGVVKAIVFIGKQNRYKGQYAMYHKAGFEVFRFSSEKVHSQAIQNRYPSYRHC